MVLDRINRMDRIYGAVGRPTVGAAVPCRPHGFGPWRSGERVGGEKNLTQRRRERRERGKVVLDRIDRMDRI